MNILHTVNLCDDITLRTAASLVVVELRLESRVNS